MDKLASNVVRLPTAARRQPPNHRFAAQHQAAMALRKAQPWPGEHVFPQVREQRKREEAMAPIRRSPELFALLCILTCFPPDRLDGLDAAAAFMLARDRDNPDALAGHALVTEATSRRRAMETLAREGR